MAFPPIFEDDFEEGNLADSGWDSETDVGNKLDFVHYSTLAETEYPTAAPYRGAYCARVVLTGGTDSANLVKAITIALAATRYFRFYIQFSPDFAATADNNVTVLVARSSTVPEFRVGFRIVASTGTITIGIGELTLTSFSTEVIERGVQYCIELGVTLDDGASNDGTVDLYTTKDGETHAESVSATQVGSLNQTAIDDCLFGVNNQLATTTGTILFDQFVFDDTRIYPIQNRHSNNNLLTKSGHAIAGPGVIQDIQLLPGGAADNILKIYDTNIADTHNLSSLVAEVRNTVADIPVQYSPSKPIRVKNGAYCVLSGTNPKAIINGYKVT